MYLIKLYINLVISCFVVFRRQVVEIFIIFLKFCVKVAVYLYFISPLLLSLSLLLSSFIELPKLPVIYCLINLIYHDISNLHPTICTHLHYVFFSLNPVFSGQFSKFRKCFRLFLKDKHYWKRQPTWRGILGSEYIQLEIHSYHGMCLEDWINKS